MRVRLPKFITRRLLAWVKERQKTRVEFELSLFSDPNNPIFIRRWHGLDRQFKRGNYWTGMIHIHEWLLTDPYPHHDHGCFNISILVEGEMTEEYGSRLSNKPFRLRHLTAGDVIIRTPWASHNIRLPEGKTATTIYISHPEIYRFHYRCTDRWVREDTMELRGKCS